MAAEAPEGVDIGDLFRMLWRRRWLIIVSVLIGTGFAIFAGFCLTPQYKAVAALLIESKEKNIGSIDHESAWVETQTELLASKSYAKQVIDRLDLTQDSEFNFTMQEEADGLGTRAMALVRDELPESVLVATGLARPMDAAEKASSGQLSEDELKALIKDVAAIILQDGVEVLRLKNSYVILVQYTSTRPRLAAAVANAIAEIYVAGRRQQKQEATKATAAWLRDRVDEVRAQLAESEAAVARYRVDNQLVASGGITLNEQELSALNRDLVEARAEYAAREAKLSIANQLIQSGHGLSSLSDVLDSPIIGNLRHDQAELARDAAQLAKEYADRHPVMVEIRAQQADLARRINEEIDHILSRLKNDVAVAKARVDSLEVSLEQSKGTSEINNTANVKLGLLEQEAEANRKVYQALLIRLKELDEQQSLPDADAQILSRASVPTEPIFPRKMLIVAGGFTASFVLGTLLALLRERFDSGLCTRSQVKELLGVPLIGLVPKVRLKRPQKLHHYLCDRPASTYAEAVREVQTALYLSEVDQPPQTILITSSMPGEGKTTLALSLGACLAGAGHRVVVVDVDLRRPAVGREIGSDVPSDGLTLYLTDKASLDEVIQSDQYQSGLDIIPVTRVVGNPAGWLASNKMARLVEELRERYRYVILDAPPLLGLSDARLVALLADVAVMAVMWSRTSRASVRKGFEALLDTPVRIAGVVLTQVDIRRQAQYNATDVVQYNKKFQKYYVD
jgi:polysaccharide biosynthesis transport protein